MLSPSDFRAIFPEFSDINAYPDAGIQFWLNYAYNNLNACRWNANLDTGAAYLTAHQVVLAKRNKDASRRGGTPGTVQGPLSSKGVGPVNASYDTSSVVNKDAGYFNSTTYGLQYWDMMMQAGAGGALVIGNVAAVVGTGPGPFYNGG